MSSGSRLGHIGIRFDAVRFNTRRLFTKSKSRAVSRQAVAERLFSCPQRGARRRMARRAALPAECRVLSVVMPVQPSYSGGHRVQVPWQVPIAKVKITSPPRRRLKTENARKQDYPRDNFYESSHGRTRRRSSRREAPVKVMDSEFRQSLQAE